MKLDRLLSITLILLNRPMVTARELSEKYGVSIRTIYRDIETISAAGIPVVAWQGKKGGFCLMNNYKIDRQLLSLNDIFSILLALRGLSTIFSDCVIDETIEKIESLVPSDRKKDADLFFNHMIVDLSPWENKNSHNHKLTTIRTAISECRLLSFNYKNLQNETIRRSIEPMSLILKSSNWYLYGFCQIKNDYRIFRLSRMYNLQILEHKFVRKDKKFNESDFFAKDQRKPIHMKLRFPSHARGKVEEFFSDFPISTEKDGSLIVDVSFPEDEWLYSTLLSYGPDCEVLSPAHLRNIIKEKFIQAANIYKT